MSEFTKGGPVHIEDLISLMKRSISAKYSSDEVIIKKETKLAVSSLEAIKNTDFFKKISAKVQKYADTFVNANLIEKFYEFDKAETGLIKASFFIQILKHTLPKVFDESELIGI